MEIQIKLSYLKQKISKVKGNTVSQSKYLLQIKKHHFP
jgi:hypothetical protein